MLRFGIIICGLMALSPSLLSTSEGDEKRLMDIAERFTTQIEVYSDLPPSDNPTWASNNAEGQLLLLFNASNSSSDQHACDLFSSCAKPVSVQKYLERINQDYKNQIEVDFTSIETLPCIKEVNDNGQLLQLRFIALKKQMIYQSTKAEHVEILVIDMNSQLIREVLFPEEIDESISTECSYLKPDLLYSENGIQQKKRFDYLITQAESAEELGRISEAINSYSLASNLRPCDMCNSKIRNLSASLSFTNQLAEALNAQEENRFSDALERAQQMKPQTDEERKKIDHLIRECEKAIALERFAIVLRVADSYYDQKFYDKARLQYMKALELKKDDPHAAARLAECSSKDSKYIIQQLNMAISDLQSANKKERGRPLRRLMALESSGQFTADLYYKIALLLDGNEKNLSAQMGFSRSQMFHSSKLYCLKSKNLGNEDARWMWYNIFNKSSQKK